jgi:hypothetical protein
MIDNNSDEYKEISAAFKLTNVEDDREVPALFKKGWGKTDKSLHYPNAEVCN